ncbi:MAG: APC family permease [Candidatus Babeliales bacterium]
MSSTAEKHKIGLAIATIVGMNAMIGSGVFAVPSALASNVGPAGILTYAFVIVAVWCMGTSIARLAKLYPEEGSFYTYSKQWGGHFLGLLSAGSYLIGLFIAMGLLSQTAGLYLHKYLSFFSPYTWGMLTLFTLTFLNTLGVVLSEAGQMVLICTTVFPLLATIILCLTKADFSHLQPFMPYGVISIFSAAKAVIFGFFGFECAASLFTVVKNPEKNVSRALTLAIVLVSILYLLFVASLILAVPLHYLSLQMPLSEILETIFPHNKWLIFGIHVSILSAIIGTIHSMIWSSSALLISYLRKFKTLFIQQLFEKNLMNQKNAVLFVGVCILISFLTLKNIDLFFSFTALFIIFAFATSMITLLTLKKEWQSKENIKTVIGLITAGVIFCFALKGIIDNLYS